jgi:quercetin dioxygenase-like cupin family protein
MRIIIVRNPYYNGERAKEVAMSTTSEEIRFGQMAIRFLVEGEESGGSVAVFEFDVPAAGRVPVAHSHDAFDETIYGLEGVLSWTIEGTKTDVSPGEVLFIPGGVVPRFDNDHGVDAKMLAIVSPGILGPGYFRDMASLLGASKDGPRPRSVRRRDATASPPHYSVHKWSTQFTRRVEERT